MTSKPYHHGDLKSALVDAACSLLKEKGADALSLRAIAAEVGVSHMAPYTHFKNKKELLQAVAAAGFDQLTEQLLKVKSKYSSPWELVLNYGVKYVEFAVANPEIYRMMLSQVDTGGRRNKMTESVAQHKAALTSPLLETSTQKPFKILRAALDKTDMDPMLSLIHI